MTTIRAAFYARVSGGQQAAAHTIESQIAALSERASNDGTPVPTERRFVDDGYSGATLIRPALDRLRDLVSVGAIDRIYATHQTGWHATTPTRSCFSTSGSGEVSKSFF
jgi:site-specific DNA recombinase